jgi:hypothetical protein
VVSAKGLFDALAVAPPMSGDGNNTMLGIALPSMVIERRVRCAMRTGRRC